MGIGAYANKLYGRFAQNPYNLPENREGQWSWVGH